MLMQSSCMRISAALVSRPMFWLAWNSLACSGFNSVKRGCKGEPASFGVIKLYGFVAAFRVRLSSLRCATVVNGLVALAPLCLPAAFSGCSLETAGLAATEAKSNEREEAVLAALSSLDEEDAAEVMAGFFQALEGDEAAREELIHQHQQGSNACITCVLVVTGILEIPSHNLMHQVRADASHWRVFGRSVGDAVCGLMSTTLRVPNKPDLLSGGTILGGQLLARQSPKGNGAPRAKGKKTAKRGGKWGLLLNVLPTISRYINPLHGFGQARQAGGLAFRQWCHDRVGVAAAFITEQLTHWGGHLLVGRGICGLAGQCGSNPSDYALTCEATDIASGQERVRVSLDTRAHALPLEVIDRTGQSTIPLEKEQHVADDALIAWRATEGSRLALNRDGLMLERPSRAPLPLVCALEEAEPMVDWSGLRCDQILDPAEIEKLADQGPQRSAQQSYAVNGQAPAVLLQPSRSYLLRPSHLSHGLRLLAPAARDGQFRTTPLLLRASPPVDWTWRNLGQYGDGLFPLADDVETDSQTALVMHDRSRVGRLTLKSQTMPSASGTLDVTQVDLGSDESLPASTALPPRVADPQATKAQIRRLNSLYDCLERPW